MRREGNVKFHVRILWVKAGKLLPVNTGGRIRSFNLLRHLQNQHQVSLISYYDGPKDHDYEAELASQIPGAVPIVLPARTESSLGSGFRYLAQLLNPAPYAVSKFSSPLVQTILNRNFVEKQFDVAVCDFLSASLNFPAMLSRPAALFQHNVESILWERMAKHEPSRVRKLAFGIEARKMRRYETASLRRFHHVIAVSEEDRRAMAQMDRSAEITVTPTGVDLEHYKFSPVPSTMQPRVVFLGSMDWEPNIDGVEFFCREIWPAVLTQAPNAIFQIVGRNPHERVRRLASSSVEVTGTVPSTAEYIRNAEAFVVPLRIGGGTRLKIYEAMATGRPVISTTVGAEGLDVHDGEDILIADSPDSFSRSVIGVLQDCDLKTRIGVAAAKLASRYDWAVIAAQFASVLERVVRDFTSRNGKNYGESEGLA